MVDQKEENLIDRQTVSSDVLQEMEYQEMEKQGKDAQYSSPFKSFINSVKIFLGNTFLTIPYVFKHTGWIGGIMLYVIVAVLSTYTMKILMDVSHGVSKKLQDDGRARNVKSFSDLALKVQGPKGKLTVDIGTILT